MGSSFFLMKVIWLLVNIYLRTFKKIVHPISSSVTVETLLPSTKVILIPTFWDNYSYLVISGKYAVIIDPSDAKKITSQVKKNKVEVCFILVTHDHIDHVAGVKELQKKFKTVVIFAKGCNIPGGKSIEIENGYRVKFCDSEFEAISLPGHYSYPYPPSNVKNNIGWYNAKAGILFTGDVLFSCGYGFIAEGAEETMFESLKSIRSLPEKTAIFCGHEYTLGNTIFAYELDSTNEQLAARMEEVKKKIGNHQPTIPTQLKLEMELNPFLRWDDKKLKFKIGAENKSDYQTFLKIRELKNAFNKRK